MNTSSTQPVISRPERWTLLLGLYPKALHYAAYCPAEPQSLIAAELQLNPDDYLRSLEDAVYDNAVLLSDFGSVRVACQAQRFIFAPAATEEEPDLEAMFRQFFPDDEGELIACAMPRSGYRAAFSLPTGVKGFLQRTFNNPPVALHLAPLAEYLIGHNTAADSQRLYINLHHDSADMLAFGNGRLLLCNSYPIRSEKDAVYYTISILDTLRLDAEHTEVHLAGDSALREAAAEELRQFVRYVMPLSYPAEALQIDRDIAALPLHLTMLALCE